jgi:hypothetical protein
VLRLSFAFAVNVSILDFKEFIYALNPEFNARSSKNVFSSEIFISSSPFSACRPSLTPTFVILEGSFKYFPKGWVSV